MDRVLSLLGMATRARKIYLGEMVKEHLDKSYFLFIASDASDKTKERYLKKTYFYHIPYTSKYSSLDLSNAVGKYNVKVVSINDKGFGKSLEAKLKEEKESGKTNI